LEGRSGDGPPFSMRVLKCRPAVSIWRGSPSAKDTPAR
jgi:hypothetical protein